MQEEADLRSTGIVQSSLSSWLLLVKSRFSFLWKILCGDNGTIQPNDPPYEHKEIVALRKLVVDSLVERSHLFFLPGYLYELEKVWDGQ